MNDHNHNILLRLITAILLCAMLVPSISGMQTSQASAPEEPALRRAPSLRGNPNFNTSQLPAEVRTWYSRLWAAINGATYPDPDRSATSGDLYLLGRTLNDHITALLTAFRYTGDLKLLDEVDRLLELARSKLSDTNKDGYVNWRWLNDPKVTTYYGKDTHVMDEMLTHTMVAAGAYALYVNRDYKTSYAQHATFWRSYLEKDFLEKWRKRGGIDFELVHPYAHFMRFYYYMYKMTGNSTYLNEANKRAAVLDKMMVRKSTSSGVAYTWDHRINPPYGCQPTVYGMLTIGAFQDMWREGFNQYASNSYMTFYAVTAREHLLKYGITKLAGNVCGSKEESFGKFLISNLPGLAIWDNTGQIMALTKLAYSKNESIEKPTRVFIPAYMIQALYGNTAQPGEPTPTFESTPTNQPTVTVTKQPTLVPTVVTTVIPPNGRVTNGLQALYTFEEGIGPTVRDISGVGAPLDLTVSNPSAVAWVAGGMTVNADTKIASSGNATKIFEASRTSNEITLEAWIQPANVTQTGPGRILSLSKDAQYRDFMLGQALDAYTARLRTSSTTTNGTPAVATSGGVATTALTHFVYTRDAQGNARIYVNGIEVKAGAVSGNFANWENYPLVLANELTGGFPWKGSYYLVAVYSRALSAAEVNQNLSVGQNGTPSTPTPVPPTSTPVPATNVPTDTPVDITPTAGRVTAGLQSLYTFEEGNGAAVRDVSGVGAPLDLTVNNPAAVTWIPGGLSVTAPVTIVSPGAATKLNSAIAASNEITVEAWIKSASTTQPGLARIVTLSKDTNYRNFTLGQGLSTTQPTDFYAMRLRTTSTTTNGKPSLNSPVGSLTTDLAHVIYTRDTSGNTRLYVNGIEQITGKAGGTMSNWDMNYQLALANEITGGQPWLGEYYLVAIYSRALSANEILQNLSAGPNGQIGTATIAVPDLVLPTEVVPTEVVPTEEVPTEELPTEAVLTDIAPTEVVPTEVVPTDIVPTEVVPTDVVPTEVVPTQVPPTEMPPFVTPQVIEAESETVVKVGSWTAHQTDLASGLNYIYTSGALDDTLSMTFEGTRVDVVYVMHPALGSFAVAVDGALVQSVESLATEATFGAQISIANLPPGPHTVSIYPTMGTIAIDAFVVEQQTVPPTVTTEPPVQPTGTPLPTDLPPVTDEPTVEVPTSTPLPLSLPFGDTFDSGTGWTVEGSWRLDPQTAVSGASWFADSSQRGVSSILTFDGSVMLGTALNPELSFSQKASLTNADAVTVEISIDGGVSWFLIDQQVGMVTDWTLHTINLAAFQGQTIKLRIRVDTLGTVPQGAISIGYWIDNLMIQDVVATPTPIVIPTNFPTLVPPPATMVPPTQDPALQATSDVIPAETATPALPTPEQPPIDASPTPTP